MVKETHLKVVHCFYINNTLNNGKRRKTSKKIRCYINNYNIQEFVQKNLRRVLAQPGVPQ